MNNAPVPKVNGQSSENWQIIKNIVQYPKQFSSDNNIGGIIKRLDSNLKFFGNDIQHEKELRQALWVIVVVLFVYGWDTPQNRQQVINIMHKWKIDEAIFYEMKDTIETYRIIYSENDKRDLDKSIKELIELG